MPTQQNKLSSRDFSKTILGYNTSEVDEYINRLTENYSALYRENAELEASLAQALSRLSGVEKEEEQVKKTLEVAKRAADQIVSDAYGRADDIIASVKKSCDAILSNFREKIETHKSDLAEIQEAVFNFKNELFEKYRLHIELIDQIAPIYEYDELTSDKYVDRMVTNLKREIAAEYDLKLDDILSEEEKNAELLDKVDDMAEKLKDDDKNAVDKPAEAPEPDVKTAKKGGRKRKSVVPSVIELLDECEDAAKDEAGNFGKQLKLDVDALLAGTKNEK